MKPARLRLTTVATSAVALMALAACGSSGSGTTAASSSAAASSPAAAASSSAPAAAGKVELTVNLDSAETTIKTFKAMIDAFQAKNPDITVKTSTRPSGSDGDNQVKTKLATGSMEDVFAYNSGSLFQALKPEQNMVDLTNDPAIANVDKSFFPSVTANGKIYGVPYGDTMGGGILYNKEVYANLGLQVPKTWAEFEANSEKIKAAGITPVIGSFKDTWTTQLFVLGDFCNVAASNPNWAADYTANKAKYATDPVALRGFEKTAVPKAKDWLNKSAGSMTFPQAMALLGSGKGAQYPQLTFPVGTLPADQQTKIGFFGIPGDDAAKNCATIWTPGGVYINSKSKNIDAAKKFLAFVASPEGVAASYAAVPPTGPSLIKGVEIPANALPVIADIKKYIDGGNNAPALEFLSPVKGPALEQITTAVETGQTSPKEAAAQYDADVTKQAKQLNLPGW